MDIISNFFEIFNFRFWLFIFELGFIPIGMCIGGLFYLIRHKDDEIQ